MPLIEGHAHSRVRAVIYDNLQCSDCLTLHNMLHETLLPAYGGNVTFEYRDFPSVKHIWARPLAVAARYLAVQDPGVALQFRGQALNAIQVIRVSGLESFLREFAAANGIDAGQMIAGMADSGLALAVEADCQEGMERGVRKTPTLYVNGQAFIEHFTVEEVSKALEESLNSKKSGSWEQ